MKRPSTTDIIKVHTWIAKHRQLIVEMRPTHDDLLGEIERQTGVYVGWATVASILKELKITWVSKNRKTTPKNITILAKAVAELYAALDLKIPDDLEELR